MTSRDDRIVELPPGVEQAVDAPPDVLNLLRSGQRPCGTGRQRITWDRGPLRGQPIELYCAEPLCLETGSCTGPRFVAPEQQWTREEGMADRKPRKPSLQEAVIAARMAGDTAARQTGRRDERSQSTIAAHIQRVWKRARQAYEGSGEWRP